MLQAKDFASMFIGLVITLFGLLPLLSRLGVGPSWFDLTGLVSTTIISWILAVAALYLVFNSILEITNSNSVGWISIAIAFVILVLGVLPILASFGVGPGLFGLSLPGIIYNIVFIIEGLFLIIAGFAMEL